MLGGDLKQRGRAADRKPVGTIEQAGELRSARVESLRAIAALMVFASHAFFTARASTATPEAYGERLFATGGLGVFLFFVLSGYLLYLPFARAQLDGGRIDLRRYARNRFLRILPLYWAVVAILYLVAPAGAQPGDWWRFALLIQNYHPDTATLLDSPMWSLAVELQFYALLPLLAAGLALFAGRSLRRAVFAVSALGILSWGLRDLFVTGTTVAPLHPLVGTASLPTLFYLFAAGMLLALARLRVERPDAPAPRWLRGSSTAWLVGAALLYAGLAADPLRQEPWGAVAAFLAVGACVLPLRRGRVLAVLERRWLAAAGVASYSLYLWHVPLLDAIAGGEPMRFTLLAALATPVVLGVAFLSYRMIEAPFLRLRERWDHADRDAGRARLPGPQPAPSSAGASI